MEHDKCHNCNSTNFEKRNLQTATDMNGEYDVEFNLYCKDCGKYIASFDCGHWEY